MDLFVASRIDTMFLLGGGKKSGTDDYCFPFKKLKLPCALQQRWSVVRGSVGEKNIGRVQ